MSKSSGNAEMKALVGKAEKAAAYFRRLQKYSHHVVALKRSLISELHRYKLPQPVILDVVKASFLLLGEDEGQLQVIR